MAEDKKTYRGNCRCAAFVFEITIPEIKELNVCGCSICYKKNYALVFVDKEDFRIVKGRIEDLTTYTFGPGILQHMFCPTCSITTVCTHDKNPGQVAINARALQGPLDVWNMPQKMFPGKEAKPEYVAPDYSDLPEPDFKIEGESKIYHGSCHCGDIRVALKLEPIETYTENVIECSCSLCQRSGATWLYPSRAQLSWSEKFDSSKFSSYGLAGSQLGDQYFCSRCGTYMANKIKAETDEEIAKLPEGVREFLTKRRHLLPVNLRIFDGINVDSDQVKVQRLDGYNMIKPEYVNP